MKSTIKVDYESRYGGGNFGDKEPIIKIELIQTDDARDKLLSEILQQGDSFCRNIGAIQRNPGQTTGAIQYIIFRRNERERWLNDFASPIYSALIKYSGINAILVTGSEGFWFELADDYSVKSEVITNSQLENIMYDSILFERDTKFIEKFVEVWKQFEKHIEERKKEK